MGIPTKSQVDEVWNNEDDNLDLLVIDNDNTSSANQPQHSYRSEIPDRTIQDCDMSTTDRLFEKQTSGLDVLTAQLSRDRLRTPKIYKSEQSCRRHDIPAVTDIKPVNRKHSSTTAHASSMAAGKSSVWPTLGERLYNPVNHVIRAEPVPLDGPIKRDNKTPCNQKVEVKVQYGTSDCPEVLRSNQDYGYISKDSVEGLLKYDEKAISEDDPKTKPRKFTDGYWSSVQLTPDNDVNNPTRRVKPSSHMTRFEYEMKKSYNNVCRFSPRSNRNNDTK